MPDQEKMYPKDALESLVGCTDYRGPACSLEEMEEGIASGAQDCQVEAEPYRDIDFSQAKRGPVVKVEPST
jgi:hypothetical protein